jgi:transglutaminase-like putative cysteine protease
MQVRIRHETRYVYDQPVSYSIQALKLTPRTDPGQRVVNWRVISPGERLEQFDAYGNLMHVVTVETPHREMRILVDGIADLGEDIAPDSPDACALSPLAFLAPTVLTCPDAALRRLAERHLGRHPPSTDPLLDLVEGIRKAVVYEPGVTDVTHTAAEALDLGVGVCQDQAQVMVACCRAAGIPARYVSGYFYGGDAWVDVWLGPAQGWVSLDVTHGEAAGERHCRLAVGRDYLDAAPVRGMRRGGGHESMAVSVQVTSGPGQQQ